MAEGRGEAARGGRHRLEPGGLVAGGRYELMERHGGRSGLAFWRARDRRLRRDVALTFVDPAPSTATGTGTTASPGSATAGGPAADGGTDDSAAATLDRTTGLTSLYSPGVARLLDVIRGRSGGIVVTEWTPGRSLAEAAAEPRPASAAAAVRDLADAAARAEEKDLALGLDSPDRIRVTPDGRAVFAFHGVPRGSTRDVDLRGVGATLYTLLTGSWPGEMPAGSDEAAPTGGRPTPAPAPTRDPQELREDAPADASVLAMRTLDGSGVSSAATVRATIDGMGGRRPASTGRDRHAGAGFAAAGLAGRGDDGGGPSHGGDDGGGPDHGDDADAGSRPYERHVAHEADSQHRRWAIMAGSGAAAVVVIGLLLTWMLGGFGPGGDSQPLSAQLDELQRSARESRDAASSSTAAPAPSSSAAPAATAPVTATAATSWQPSASQGTAENSSTAGNVIDGDPSTTWTTETYYSQFGTGGGAYKAGVGLMLTLPAGATPGRVVLNSADDGLGFQVRAASTASPTTLEETTLLGAGTVSEGKASVDLDPRKQTPYLLVWITKLGHKGSQSFRGTVSEIAVSQ